MIFSFPLLIESTPNLREHWAVRAKRSRRHREAAFYGLLGAKAARDLPVIVVLTRIAPRELDTDNLAAGFKNVRDGVADYLLSRETKKADDSDPRIEWRYAQRRGAVKEYLVEISIMPCSTP